VNRATIYLLLDAVEAGDTRYVADVLLDELDEPEPDPDGPPRTLPPRCGVCHVRAWPGEDWRHLYSLHNPHAWRMRAAA
jgi:hypothetical protein